MKLLIKINKLIFILLLLLIFSCKLEKEESVTEYFEFPIKEFYPNGELKQNVIFRDGKKHGIESLYYEDGTLHQIGGYINGSGFGDVFEYDRGGNLIIHGFYTASYKNCLSFYREYDAKGNLIDSLGDIPFWSVYNTSTVDIEDIIEVKLILSSDSNYTAIYTIEECHDQSCNVIIENEPIEKLSKSFLYKIAIYQKKNIYKNEFYWVIKTDVMDKRENVNTENVDTIWFNSFD